MINTNLVNRYCREDISLIKNYDKAINDTTQIWECHHINEWTFTRSELIQMNMYYNRPANELIFLTRAEHNRLHKKGKPLSEDAKLKMSEAKLNSSQYSFGRKYYDYYGYSKKVNPNQYDREM